MFISKLQKVYTFQSLKTVKIKTFWWWLTIFYIMIEENRSVFFLTKNNLRDVIKDIFDEEFKKLETKLTKKSKILTRDDAAKLIGVCPNTISEYIKSGRLANRGLGRKVLILESDLEGIKPGRYTHYSKNY